jgi:fermentation-respiration switch protein FrsA (DUF1100 family)
MGIATLKMIVLTGGIAMAGGTASAGSGSNYRQVPYGGWSGGAYFVTGPAYPAIRRRDRGFFRQREQAEAGAWDAGGRAVFDYDRGYPYDSYGEAGWGMEEAESRQRPASCRIEWTRDSSGGRVPVRICVN